MMEKFQPPPPKIPKDILSFKFMLLPYHNCYQNTVGAFQGIKLHVLQAI